MPLMSCPGNAGIPNVSAVSAIGSAARFWDSARLWRRAAAVLAATALALLVAALVGREVPDFAERPVIAVLRDTGQHSGWAVRLAQTAHQIALDSLDPPPPPAGKDYQLWLVAPGAAAPEPLGVLPLSGRKIVAETPATVGLLAGKGELRVTLEPANGTLAGAPSGAPVLRGSLGGPG
jgi:anti-sigma-K factor RskA